MTAIWENNAWPEFSFDAEIVEPALYTCTRSFGAWEGLLQGLNAAERDELILGNIVAEALGSFAIEGVQLSQADIQNSVIRSMSARNLEGTKHRSDRIADVMLDARNIQSGLTAERLCHWHHALFFGMEIEDIGRWRRFPMVIAKSAVMGDEEVLYRAVPHEVLDAEMERFFEWLELAEEVPPIKAALAHIYFESLHPFSDGNGRLGRALIENVLAGAGIPSFALSRQIGKEKAEYYDALQKGRLVRGDKIDATAFVKWLLEAMTRAMEASILEAKFLLRRNAFLLKFQMKLNGRQEQVLRRLFVEGEGRVLEGISAKTYAKISGTSPATATRDLADLREKGALKLGEAGGRSTYYELVW